MDLSSLQSSLSQYLDFAKQNLNSPAKILRDDPSWTIARLNKQCPAILLRWLSSELNRVISFSGAKHVFADEDGIENTKDLIYLIVHEYGHFKISDLMLVFKNAKLGKYGEIYRMDGMTILKWVREYDQERLEASRKLRKQKLQEESSRHQSAEVDPEGLKKLAELYGKLAAKKISKEIKPRITIEQYFSSCSEKQNNWEKETRSLYDSSDMTLHCDYDTFRAYRAAQLLHEINKTNV